MGTTYPPPCGNACGPIFIRQRSCESKTSYSSTTECVCVWDGAKSHIAECQACTRFTDAGNANLQGEYTTIIEWSQANESYSA